MVAPRTLTLERLREVLAFDPDTGVFRWMVRLSNRVTIGDVAGCRVRMGGSVYVQIRIGGRLYMAHQLAWFYTNGEWVDLIDHRDLDGENNRLLNLREATPSQNQFNRARQSNNSTGFKGVTFHGASKLYMARITASGKCHLLGYFKTAEEAHGAYAAAAHRLHGEFARLA